MKFKQSILRIITLLFLFLQSCNFSTENPSNSSSNSKITPTFLNANTPTKASMSPSSTSKDPDADVVFVKAIENQDGTWTFHVTVEHLDTGWEDYADGWDLVLPDGTVLKPDRDSTFTRLLLHPHVNEQPFTRSQSNIEIPEGTTEVRVRAHDIVDGFGGQEVIVDLTREIGENFEVERFNG